MIRALVRCLWVIPAATGALVLAPACGEQKKAGSKVENATQCLSDLMDSRRKRAVAGIPASDDPDQDEHPWLAWVKKNSQVAQGSDFKACAIKGEGTPVRETAETLMRYFDDQRGFYADEKKETKEYLGGLVGAQRVSKGTTWEADVEFDALFFHAATLARYWTLLQSTPRDDRVTIFFANQLLLWNFDAKTSLYEEEISLLCQKKLGDYCKAIPMEDRPFAITRPYFEGVAGLFDAYKDKYPQSPYATFAARIAGVYKARAAKVPEYKEFPVLPAIRSTKPAPYSNNATFLVSQEKGLFLMDNPLRVPNPPPPANPTDKPKPAWKGDYALDPGLAKEVAILVQDVRSNMVSQFNQSLIYFVAEGKVPVQFIEPLLRACIEGEHAKNWPSFVLVGRRRADGTNRRSGFNATLSKVEEVGKFKVKAPTSGKVLSCEAWASIGKDQLGGTGFKPIVFHEGAQIHIGRLNDDGTIASVQSAAGHGDGERLEKWADQQNMSMVVAVPQSATYEQWLEAINGVAYKCEDDECSRERGIKVFLATCK
ncbi:MAG: hypothetical protein FJ100_01305 [Deltaproteobacteria bacterium]|nr:hypothetical protein [Deltaproteobacteria bacterium]